MAEIQSVRDVLVRAEKDFRRRLYRRGLFDRQEMKELAAAVSRKHMGAIPDETLLRLAEHDSWLRNGKFHGPHFHQKHSQEEHYPGKRGYPGDSIGIIADQLYHFLKHTLRHVVDSFWEGTATAVFTVTTGRVELVGFYGEERPLKPKKTGGPSETLSNAPNPPYA